MQVSVYTMIFGATIAASEDLAFSLSGYIFVTMNNVFTASNGVYLKKKLDARDLGKNGLLFYNSLFMIPVAVVVAAWFGELEKVNINHFKCEKKCLMFDLHFFRLGITLIGMIFGSYFSLFHLVLWDLFFHTVLYYVLSITHHWQLLWLAV